MKHLLFGFFTLFLAGVSHAQTSIKLSEVGSHIGDSVTVCGKIADLRYFENSKNKPTFLNVGAKFPNQQLTVVIWETVRTQFSSKVEDLLDKDVCITGRIILYKEKPEIVIDSPGQIIVQ
ncbi:MAG TPA: hypothetical protein VHL77_01505 [Ferruginibacter sp.]|nr:hypothetical protein [Ferruginibacter sp.]